MWVRIVQLDLDEALTLAQFSLRDAHAVSPVEHADALREVAAWKLRRFSECVRIQDTGAFLQIAFYVLLTRQ